MIVARNMDPARTRKLGVLLALLGVLAIPLPAPGQADNTAGEATPNPAGMTLQRDHPEEFTGGEEVWVTVTINRTTSVPLFALGLYETAPNGWTFQGLHVDAGPTPDILPPMGATGVLEFGWISPAVPVQLRYALRVPPADEGTRVLSGQVEYRLETDPRHTSSPTLTRLAGKRNEPPEIRLRGPERLTWPLNRPFTDPGATAQDAEDGDISDRIEVAGQVDSSEPGSYTLTYGVADDAGQRATPITRTVTVRDQNNSEAPGGSDGDPAPPSPAVPTAMPGPANSVERPIAPDVNGPSQDIEVPDVALGGNRPTHVLPRGGVPAESTGDGERPSTDPGSLPNGRLARGVAPSAPDSRLGAAGKANRNAALPANSTPDGMAPDQSVPVVISGVLVLALLGAGLGWVLLWKGRHGTARRPRR